MGNANAAALERGDKPYAAALFHELDLNHNGYLTLKDLMDTHSPAHMLPRSLPTLYFFDQQKDGRIREEDLTALVNYCQSEKLKIEEELCRDKSLRELILRASQAGVKDCSVHGRSSYRRFSSYSKVWSVFCSKQDHDPKAIATTTTVTDNISNEIGNNPISPPTQQQPHDHPPNEPSSDHPSDHSNDQQQHVHHHRSNYASSSSSSSSSETSSLAEHDHEDPNCDNHLGGTFDHHDNSHHEDEDEDEDDVVFAPQPIIHSTDDDMSTHSGGGGQAPSGVAMYSSQRQAELNHYISGGETSASSTIADNERSSIDNELLNPQNRTAVDAAVLENVVSASIHKLADLLHADGSREIFMEWLWALADFNSSGVVTLEELRVFLAALSEDGIDLEELAFHKDGGEPLEVCIINEFDTTHAGLLSRDEFMVLADLVTKEYEFWENRHLDRIGDYELGRTIGRGSSGVVRLAFHVEKRKRFAVKIIKKGKCSDLSRLDREIQSLMAAKHEHIVSLEQVLESETNIFIVMELCGGGSMVDIVRLYPEERMPEETARFFMRQVFGALEFCHAKGICHRDVRLENFMLDNAGNVKVTDFGHSGMFSPNWDLFSTLLVGSVHNLSPEQIRGQVYSGEKIDIWSAGVAVYCLLVGHPPFLEPDVNLLMQRIVECSYSIPDFVSDEAKDLIRCMVRESPDDRIPIRQMLHHPWFYGGPEYGPSMNVVVFPVDCFYLKRPDIAEMILAMTIYQHNLHFHLADQHNNPNPAPDELRGQDWTLRCLCPRNDIKFTVSLSTKPPAERKKQTQPEQNDNELALLPASIATADEDIPDDDQHPANPADHDHDHDDAPHRPGTPTSPVTQQHNHSPRGGNLSDSGTHSHRQDHERERERDVSSARPPRHRRQFKVTPMNVAAHIRENGANSFINGDPFDFEPGDSIDGVHSFQDEWLRQTQQDDDGVANMIQHNGRICDEHEPTSTTDDDDDHNDSEPPHIEAAAAAGDDVTSKKDKERRSNHHRSHSLDDSVGLKRLNRSATVDAFPYQKVIPQREMPDCARNLDFSKGKSQQQGNNNSSHNARGDEFDSFDSTSADFSTKHPESAPITPTFHKADGSGAGAGSDAVNPFAPDGARSPQTNVGLENEIALKLARHPLKTVSPQSPQIGRLIFHASPTPSMDRPGPSEDLQHHPHRPDATTTPSNTPLMRMRDSTTAATTTTTNTLLDNNNVDANSACTSNGMTVRNEDQREQEQQAECEAAWNCSSDEDCIRLQPFIEVRLQDGEAGLFLKICRKLKRICLSKLGEVAERKKNKMTNGRRSLTTLRRTASARSIETEHSHHWR